MNRELISTGFSGTNLLLAFAAGAVVGTIAALLLAPAPGAETRRKVRETARDATHKPKELAHRVTEAVRESRHAAGEQIAEALSQAR
jgi:gas vesicle protein